MIQEWNKVNILPDLHNKSLLAPVSFPIGILNNVQQVTLFDGQQNLLKRNSSLSNKPVVLRGIPTKDTLNSTMSHCVPIVYNSFPSGPPVGRLLWNSGF